MAQRKKRINISLDCETYNALLEIKKQYGFNSCPEVLVAFAHVFVRCVSDAEDRRRSIEINDQAYIEEMFNIFSNSTIQPSGIVPKKGYEVHIDSETWQRTKTTKD